MNSTESRLESVIWHELGHYCIGLIFQYEIIDFTIEYQLIDNRNHSWAGNVELKYTINNNLVTDLKNIEFFCHKIINYFSGSVFEASFINTYSNEDKTILKSLKNTQ